MKVSIPHALRLGQRLLAARGVPDDIAAAGPVLLAFTNVTNRKLTVAPFGGGAVRNIPAREGATANNLFALLLDPKAIADQSW